MLQHVTATALALKSGDWSALAAWAGVLLALIAGTIAFCQLQATQRVRREQARAYVVAYMESSPAGDFVIDFVVKNFGTTAAAEVEITSDPPMRRADDADVELP